jgi:hypothetical protein
MNQESKNLIYEVINTLSTFPDTLNKSLTEKLRLALRDGEKYNGWPNYETWNMHLILSNNHNIYTTLNEVILNEFKTYLSHQTKPQDALYEVAEWLKMYIEDNYQLNNESFLIKVDCEYWTYRDYQEIQWLPIVKAFLEDYLRENGYKEE